MGYCLSHAPLAGALPPLPLQPKDEGTSEGASELAVGGSTSWGLYYKSFSHLDSQKYTWTILNVNSMTWHHTNNLTCWNSIGDKDDDRSSSGTPSDLADELLRSFEVGASWCTFQWGISPSFCQLYAYMCYYIYISSRCLQHIPL